MKISITVLTLSLLMFSCTAQQGNASRVSADEFEKAISIGKQQVLDVRSAGEFAYGHIPGSMQADWTNRTEFADRTQHLDRSKPVYIYCASGPRSTSAAIWLKANGFQQVVELDGGYISWRRARKPIEEAKLQKQLTLEEYKAQIPATGTVLVDFGAEWCPPCVKMGPVLSEVMTEKAQTVKLLKIDVGVHTNILEPLQINSYPTFIVYKNGQETWRQSGIVDKATLLAQLN